MFPVVTLAETRPWLAWHRTQAGRIWSWPEGKLLQSLHLTSDQCPVSPLSLASYYSSQLSGSQLSISQLSKQTRAPWAPTFAAQRARTRPTHPDARTVIFKMLSSLQTSGLTLTWKPRRLNITGQKQNPNPGNRDLNHNLFLWRK